MGVFVGLGLTVLALTRTEVGSLAAADLWDRAHPAPLALAMVLMSAAFYFMAWRWRALMPPPHAPPAAGLAAVISAGLLLNYAVPGPFGELGAAWFAHRRYGIPLAAALASGVAARIVGLATAALLAGGVGLFTDLPIPDGYDTIVAVAAVMVGGGGVVLAWLAARPQWWKRLAHRSLRALPVPARLAPKRARLEGAITTVADALEEVAGRGPAAYARAVGWSMAGHTTVIAGICVAVHSLGAELHLAGIFFTYATTTAGAVALFALPGSQVGWDAMFVTLLLGTAGLSATDAVAIALLVRVQQLSLMVVGAGAVVWLLRPPATGTQVDPPPHGGIR